MKKRISILLATLLLLCLLSLSAFAAEEKDISKIQLPKPQTPNYFMYIDGNGTDGRADELRMIMVADRSVIDLTSEWDRDSDAFYEKYGLWYFNAYMQYDVSLDGEDNWQYTSEWDSTYYIGGYDEGYQSESLRSALMEEFGFFDLYFYNGPDTDTFKAYRPALTSEKYYWGDGYEKDVYSFDTANHNLYIRCRYYIEWEPLVHYEDGYDGPGERQSMVSEWSDSAVFGRNSTQVVPEEPTVYEAPVISDLSVKLADIGNRKLELDYVQTTPESVWLANIYYMMKGEGSFDGLETQVSIDGSDWISFDTYNSWGDWCLCDGIRTAGADDVPVKDTSHIKLRIRFLGTHGPSEWSNVLEINKPAEEEHKYEVSVEYATCLKEGLKTYTCLCGDKYTEVIPKLPHQISDEYTIDVPATCSKEGSKSKHCINGCDMKEDVTVVPKLSHNYSDEYTVDEQPTCSKEGSKSRHCVNDYCDAKTDVTKVATLAHKYSDKYTVDVQPTCTKEGTESRHCENYGCDAKTDERKVEKLPHPLRDYLTKATLSKNGKIVTKCHVCGYVSKTETVYYPKTIKLSATKFTYNGKKKTPKLIIKDAKGKELLNSVDYIYHMPEERTEIDKYTVEVIFMGNYEGEKKLTFYILPPATKKITVSYTTSQIKASWKKVKEADGYKVELLNSKGKAVKKATTTKTAYTFKKLTAAKDYTVKVTAYKTFDKQKVYSVAYNTLSTITKPSKISLTKVKAGEKKATVYWNTLEGATGYEVMYSTSKKFKSAKTITVKKGTTKKKTIKKLKADKKYYFKVRAYKTVNGKKVYGVWSEIKSVTVKAAVKK